MPWKEKQGTNWKKFLTFSFGGNKDNKEPIEEKPLQEKEKINTKQILKLTEENIQKNYIMAECCHPIPGDDVLGYMDENDRIINPQTPVSRCRTFEEQLREPYSGYRVGYP